MVDLLLTKHANPNPRGAVTPLQCVVLSHCILELTNYFIKIMEALLAAETDVNGIGNDEAIVAHLRYKFQDLLTTTVTHIFEIV